LAHDHRTGTGAGAGEQPVGVGEIHAVLEHEGHVVGHRDLLR
jgi:hypothetical protein